MTPFHTLALDTSTAHGGVVLLRDADVCFSKTWPREKSHSEILTAQIETVCTAGSIELQQIDLIAVGCGPGSFTGIRVAINAAKALAFVHNTPIMAFDTFEILAAGVPCATDTLSTPTRLATLVNAHKNLVYTSLFELCPEQQTWKRTADPQALTLDQLEALITEPHLCVGDWFGEMSPFLTAALRQNLQRDPGINDFPQAEVLAKMAFTQRSSRPPLDWKSTQALYIRASEAEEKLRSATASSNSDRT